ncbi:hypothetical protein MAR_009963 [Mya arenaria]|uniref:VWFA domain-containing protein n=1 Tax=Mya arenaria TaxID=6604 RepID=A0ABY7E0T4_MYAAR|nr:uncharacterized protein LOC128232242 [Mya arenaria]WAR03405.1 hypothetical protein MAR_009963 [Mya arenaria]
MAGLPPGGVFELAICFDTTGSMSRVIDEVKGRVQDMIQRLQADIPAIRIAVLAHGDYCDAEVFYLEKHVDFTTNVAELTDFINNVDGTGGGDPEECYEYMMRLVRGLQWMAGSQRALVMIGDSVPHEPGYDLNTDNIDWRQEAREFASMGIKIYGVQAFEEEASAMFFEELAMVTSGEHLQLSNLSNIVDFIMAICYRERGAEYLDNYEAEVRAREARMGLNKDLEGLFGVLRRGDSGASLRRGHSNASLKKGNSNASLRRGNSNISLRRVNSAPSRTGSLVTAASTLSTMSAVAVPPTPISPITSTSTSSVVITASASVKRIRQPKRTVKSPAINQKKTLQGKPRVQKIGKTKSAVLKGLERQTVPDSKFLLKGRTVCQRWSQWKLAIRNDRTGSSTFQKVNPKAFVTPFWIKKRLFPRDALGRKALYEVAVQRGPHKRRQVVFCKACTIRTWTNWYKVIFNTKSVKIHLQKVLQTLGANVYVRRFRLDGFGKRQRELVQRFKVGRFYKYAWQSPGTPPSLTWAMQ